VTLASTPYDKLIPIPPNRSITLEMVKEPIATRRNRPSAPSKAVKTTILCHVAAVILANYPATNLFLCLMDEGQKTLPGMLPPLSICIK